jgi:hypothetical protein
MERPRPHGHAGHQVTAGFNRFEDRARPFSPHAVGPRVGAREGGRARRRLAPTGVRGPARLERMAVTGPVLGLIL